MVRQSQHTRYVMGTDLRELPPVQVMAGIIFEDEDVVDFVLVPGSTRQSEQEKKEIDEEVTSVYL
jgi:hypothetical protein